MTDAVFHEKITPFLKEKLNLLESTYGKDSKEYQGIALQYLRDEKEGLSSKEQNIKHYEAETEVSSSEGEVHGIERLYAKSLVIEPTLVCLAHCRYCLRSNYPIHTLTEKQLVDVAKYCGNENNREVLSEVLITGGEPLIIPQRIEVLLNALIEYAPNIKIFRIGTRLPGQDPKRIDENVVNLFKNKPSVRFEVGTQINSPVEFFPEVIEALNKISELGVKIYSQNVLLKGVNDEIDTLTELYNKMRMHNIEAHYLFHCIPMIGIHHLRTSVARGIELEKELVCSGRVSGRAKPMYAAMTDIGKITFYEGVIQDNKDGKLLLQSHYRLSDRLAWNPTWKLPESAEVDDKGYIRVWYVDGEAD